MRDCIDAFVEEMNFAMDNGLEITFGASIGDNSVMYAFVPTQIDKSKGFMSLYDGNNFVEIETKNLRYDDKLERYFLVNGNVLLTISF